MAKWVLPEGRQPLSDDWFKNKIALLDDTITISMSDIDFMEIDNMQVTITLKNANK